MLAFSIVELLNVFMDRCQGFGWRTVPMSQIGLEKVNAREFRWVADLRVENWLTG